jgi:hypothetical protein
MKLQIIITLSVIFSGSAWAMNCGEIEQHLNEIAFQNNMLPGDLARANSQQMLVDHQQNIVNEKQGKLNYLDEELANLKTTSQRIENILQTKYSLDAAVADDIEARRNIAAAIESGLNAKMDAPLIDKVIFQLNEMDLKPAVRNSVVAFVESLRATEKQILSDSLKLTLFQLREPDSAKSRDISDLLTAQLIDLLKSQNDRSKAVSKERDENVRSFQQADFELAQLKTQLGETNRGVQSRRDKIASETRILGNNRCPPSSRPNGGPRIF